MWTYSCLSPDDRTSLSARSAILQRFMDLRLRYVTEMGWLDGIDSDHDVYDDTDRTLYLVRCADASASAGGVATETPPRAISAGMRITRVASFYDSLTWTMLAANPATQADIIAGNFALISDINRQAHAADRGLWDMTRLVTPLDGSVAKPEVIRSIYELLGMAMYKTAVEPKTDPIWMFLTTSTMKRLFEMSGMECTVLFGGRVKSSDDDESFLCITRPMAAYRVVKGSLRTAHQRALERVLDGCSGLQNQDLATAGA